MNSRIGQDEKLQLIESLCEFVNAPIPRTAEEAAKPFQWALDLTRERKKVIRRRITLDADAPGSGSDRRNLLLAQSARRIARLTLWWLATENDQALPTPVLFEKAGHPKVTRALNLEDWEGARLFEAPLTVAHYVVSGDTVTLQEIPVWDRVSTCVGHALDLLLTDYRGLRSRVRACPYLKRGSLDTWKVEQIGRDHALHFFIDHRFKRGQVQFYCTTKHRQTAYMRRFRGKITEG